MTFLTTTLPVPIIQTAIATIRPLLGMGLFFVLGLLAAMLTVFRPLMLGIARAALLVVKPRLSLEERRTRRTFHGVLMLNRLANEYDASQPNLASELRNLASRG